MKKLIKKENVRKTTVQAYACTCYCNDCNPCASTPSTAYINQRDSYTFRAAGINAANNIGW